MGRSGGRRYIKIGWRLVVVASFFRLDRLSRVVSILLPFAAVLPKRLRCTINQPNQSSQQHPRTDNMKSSIMNLLLSTSFLCLTASATEPDQSPSNILRRSTIELQKRCVGDCVSCFGDGYTECPGSSYYCYKPGDTYYGLESCSSTGSGSSDSGSSASAAPTSDSSSSSGSGGFNYSIPEFCSSGGGDCKTCFGSTYVKCPNDDFWCYDPNNSTTTCPSDDNGGGGSSAGSGSSASGSSGGFSSGFASSSIYSSASAASSFDTSTYTTSAASGGETTDAPVIGGGAGSSDTSSDDFGFGLQSSTTSASGSSGGASQTSSFSSGEATDAPASATTNGQGSLREGMVGALFAGVVCFAAGWVGVGAGM